MDHEREFHPFFPLSVFLLPGEDIPLRIFEPRYQQLMADIRETGRNFVVPYVHNGIIQAYGCEVRLKEVVAEHAGGRMVITVEALHVIEMTGYKELMPGKLYSGGSIRRLEPWLPLKNPDLQEMIREYAGAYDPAFLSCCLSEVHLVTSLDLLKALNLSSEDKFKFMQMKDQAQKEEYLAGQMRYLHMIRKQETQLDSDFGLN
ncbi:MAG: hypothetical protein R2751_12350 [Bacteroidales bacterium]